MFKKNLCIFFNSRGRATARACRHISLCMHLLHFHLTEVINATQRQKAIFDKWLSESECTRILNGFGINKKLLLIFSSSQSHKVSLYSIKRYATAQSFSYLHRVFILFLLMRGFMSDEKTCGSSKCIE